MKKTISLLMVLILALSVFTIAPVGAAVTDAAPTGASSGTNGDCRWTLDDNGVLTISGSGRLGNTYEPEFPKRDVKKVVIQKGVTMIGGRAFRYFSYMTDVTIPDTVTGIGLGAFDCCYRLTGVTIPNSVTEIGNYAFYNCISLTSVTISNSVTSISDFAFQSCTSLTSVTIPDSVTKIGDSAFNVCTSLTSVTIPDSVTSIGENAFSSCTSLTSVTIPDSVTEIGEAAFSSCTSLTSVTIPDSVTSISDFAFSSCTSLTSVIIPDSVTYLSGFSSCSGLTSITIPDSVTEIGDEAFDCCTGLTSVTIGNSVTEIGDSAFRDCTSLKSVTIPDSVTKIGDEAFDNCTGLTSVTIPNSVTYLSGFSNCTGLTSVTIPDSVTEIGYKAFSSCTSLKSVTIPDSVTEIGYKAFSECTSLKSVTIGNSVTKIGEGAFDNCTGLTSVTIPNSVTYLSGFSNCTGLTSVTIPDSVTDIGYEAFYSCTSLTSVIIPDSVTGIDIYAFSDCTSLTSITIPDSVTEISDGAFQGCSGLTSVIIPDSVTKIGDEAFYSCTSLKSVTIPDSVTDIGYHAFGYYSDYDYDWNLKVSGFTITGYKGTAAESYADENGFTFNPLKSYTVTFDPNGHGSFDNEKDKVQYVKPGGKAVSPRGFNTDVDWEWEFIDWYTDKACTKKYDFNTPVNADLTLYAKWQSRYCTVTFIPNKAPNNQFTQQVRRGNKVNSYFAFAIPAGWRFDGWFTDKACTKKYDFNTPVNADLTLYGKWTQTNLATPTLKKIENTASGVKLSWNRVTNAKKYRVMLKNGSAWRTLATVASTNYTYKSAKSGKKYTLTVCCLSDDGKTVISKYNTSGKSITFIAKPALPTLKNTKSGVQITIKKVAGAAKYRILRKLGSGKWTKVADTTKLKYVDKTAKNGKTYKYTIACVDKKGKSLTSAYNTAGKSIKCKR